MWGRVGVRERDRRSRGGRAAGAGSGVDYLGVGEVWGWEKVSR